MIIGASSFAGTLPELISEIDSIELYIPKLEVYEGTKLIRSRIKRIKDIISSYKILKKMIFEKFYQYICENQGVKIIHMPAQYQHHYQ
jgi:hypothetical protein